MPPAGPYGSSQPHVTREQEEHARAKRQEKRTYTESQDTAEKIRQELQRLRESQAELASAMLQFLQHERESTRKVKEIAALILTAIAVHRETGPHQMDHSTQSLLDDIAEKTEEIYNA
jgi:hypothetical protein